MNNVSHTVPTFMDRTILETASGAFTSFQSPPELPGSNALDGSLETCTYSIIGDNPFWAVDFAKEMDVGEIQIRNTEGSGELHCIHAYYNIWRARQTGRYFAGDILKCIFMNDNISFCFNFEEIRHTDSDWRQDSIGHGMDFPTVIHFVFLM